VNPAINLGVGLNVISSFANINHEQALGIEDSNAIGSASNRGNPVGHALLEEMGSDTGGNLLTAPTHTPPQSKPPSPFSCHRGWATGRERERDGTRGVKKFTCINTVSSCRLLISYYFAYHTKLFSIFC